MNWEWEWQKSDEPIVMEDYIKCLCPECSNELNLENNVNEVTFEPIKCDRCAFFKNLEIKKNSSKARKKKS